MNKTNIFNHWGVIKSHTHRRRRFPLAVVSHEQDDEDNNENSENDCGPDNHKHPPLYSAGINIFSSAKKNKIIHKNCSINITFFPQNGFFRKAIWTHVHELTLVVVLVSLLWFLDCASLNRDAQGRPSWGNMAMHKAYWINAQNGQRTFAISKWMYVSNSNKLTLPTSPDRPASLSLASSWSL